MQPKATERSAPRRLIEAAFPLRQASTDSLHEKNVRHGHISTLHIWPARRPLAACRAALIASLLPDPGTDDERMRLIERIGGKVVTRDEQKKVGGRTVTVEREETLGGVLHWGRESSPDIEWFRQEIKKEYGGRSPRVLDPFAGGGAIPLEAMRLGCETTAVDINPVAWFLLKCTLEYPQKLSGQHRPLPSFALRSPEFMSGFFKGSEKLTKKQLERNLNAVTARLFPPPDVGLEWHVRAWGWWVLQQARRHLASSYPTYAEFEPLDGAENWRQHHPDRRRALVLAELDAESRPNLTTLNAEFSSEYRSNRLNPRWVAKPTVAYLWARTVSCKNCRATIPLLKTRWLCKKGSKRVLLTMEPNPDRTGVVFGIQAGVPLVGGNSAQRRESDKRMGMGTMSRAGAWCPCCGGPGTVAMEMEDNRQEGLAGRLGAVMTAVVVDGQDGKEYRLPTEAENVAAHKSNDEVSKTFESVPFGIPSESLPSKDALGFRVPLYGFDKWSTLFTPRQLASLGTFVNCTRTAFGEIQAQAYPAPWSEAVAAYLASMLDRLANQSSSVSRWNLGGEKIEGTFARFAMPILWDFAEVNPLAETSGGYTSAFEWVSLVVKHCCAATAAAPPPHVMRQSAIQNLPANFDLIVTDPPYYDAISYSDLMDFFHVWLRRTLAGVSAELDGAFRDPLSPKWNADERDGELIDDSSRHGGDRATSKNEYEDGMSRAFESCHRALSPDGRLVIVFAHKQPDAWETLVSAIIRAGFVVDGSWPIQTERSARTRSLSSAALSSSVWLVCRQRPDTARVGWDNTVLNEMKVYIHDRLRQYWDAGIRGPDFVWAATGPALEVYSRHPVVKKANEPAAFLDVSEFLRAVRRIVVDFVVGRVLSKSGDETTVTGLDDVTTYYLLHRHDFGLDDAPIGPCILYAVSCGLSDAALADQHDLLIRTGGKELEETEEPPDEEELEEGTGSKVRLKAWSQRQRRSMGLDSDGRPAPLIDQIHRLMHLWKAGDVTKVDDYLEVRLLSRNALFQKLLQALIELAGTSTDERSILESLSNHLTARPAEISRGPGLFSSVESEDGERQFALRKEQLDRKIVFDRED